MIPPCCEQQGTIQAASWLAGVDAARVVLAKAVQRLDAAAREASASGRGGDGRQDDLHPPDAGLY
jgi:hypothetical protein